MRRQLGLSSLLGPFLLEIVKYSMLNAKNLHFLCHFWQKHLVVSKKSSTFAANFAKAMEKLLRQFKNIPITTSALQTVLPERASFIHFISGLVKSKKLIRLKRGLYVVSPEVSNMPLSHPIIANSLYGPSYISFFSALSYYGLIDDVPQSYYSAALKQDKYFETQIGRFNYISVPLSYYPIGIKRVTENGCSCLIATPEKALCDTILHSKAVNLRSKKDAITYLEEDLRFDTDALKTFDVNILQECADCGYKRNSILQIVKLIQS